ncbi:uncharacterized protein J4E87_003888 [Alternaria ethzedia]|uniref:uncharacterized protein n=1 Tax=Alternaria ethzedia TaxID=181014 RepID=UPI0020C585FE|nr:uncharacterized protein J4E87_003888 [Alternaria ethzedia]KAI4627325.1 hypothetical protein J4E87_003888 [Alternaria ethzedia]
MTSSKFTSNRPIPAITLQLATDDQSAQYSQPLPHGDFEELKEAANEDRDLKIRIRKLRLISRTLALFISIAVLVLTALTLHKFLSTRSIHRVVRLPSGENILRTPWAKNTRAWPTYMYFGVAAVSVLLNFATIFSYKCGIEQANVAAVVTTATVYRTEKDKNGKSDDLWGWTCSSECELYARLLPTWLCATIFLLTPLASSQETQDECDRECLLLRVETLEKEYAKIEQALFDGGDSYSSYAAQSYSPTSAAYSATPSSSSKYYTTFGTSGLPQSSAYSFFGSSSPILTSAVSTATPGSSTKHYTTFGTSGLPQSSAYSFVSSSPPILTSAVSTATPSSSSEYYASLSTSGFYQSSASTWVVSSSSMVISYVTTQPSVSATPSYATTPPQSSASTFVVPSSSLVTSYMTTEPSVSASTFTVSSSSIVISYATTQPSLSATPSYAVPPPEPTASDTPPEPTNPNIPTHPGYRSVAYYGNWDIYARNFQPQQIPAERITHLLYSFADNKPDGTVFLTDTYADAEKHYPTDSWNDVGNNLYGSMKQLQILKAKNRNLKVLLSVGGWTYTNVAKHMDGPMATAAGRQRFASSCVELIRDYGFDGIDVDWEYPTNKEQGGQLLALLKEIRSQMDEYADTLVYEDESGRKLKPKFLLTIASPAGEKNYKHLPLKEISAVTDFINLMAYDYAGSWDNQTGHQSNLYPSTSTPLSTPFNTASVLAAYSAAGVPSSKLNLGMPLYGRSFTNTQGLGTSFSGIGTGSFERGVYDFKDLPLAGAQEYYDEEAGATYSYDEASGEFVSYDTVAMALKKVDYIAEQGLGGAMWWEISGDRTDDSGSIVTNVVEKMGGGSGAGIESSPNWLLYPDSKFDNMRNGVSTTP